MTSPVFPAIAENGDTASPLAAALNFAKSDDRDADASVRATAGRTNAPALRPTWSAFLRPANTV